MLSFGMLFVYGAYEYIVKIVVKWSAIKFLMSYRQSCTRFVASNRTVLI